MVPNERFQAHHDNNAHIFSGLYYIIKLELYIYN